MAPERLAVQQEDALVALTRRGDVRLGDDPVAAARGEQLQHRARVPVSSPQQHNAAPP